MIALKLAECGAWLPLDGTEAIAIEPARPVSGAYGADGDPVPRTLHPEVVGGATIALYLYPDINFIPRRALLMCVVGERGIGRQVAVRPADQQVFPATPLAKSTIAIWSASDASPITAAQQASDPCVVRHS